MPDAFIGRHAELQRVVEALKLTRTGHATTLIVRGDAGVGKSRFLDEVLAQAELLGHRVLVGRLDDLDRYVPFHAIHAALAPALAAESEPALRPIVEEVADTLRAAGAGATESEVPLARLVSHVETLLREWSRREPVVLAIDDLHAADADTSSALSLLIRRLQDDPVAIIATVRTHSPDVPPALSAAIERLGRDGLAMVVDLLPLDIDDVRGLIRLVLGAAPDDRLLQCIWDATSGNPFYVAEGLRSLEASGDVVVAEERARLKAGGPPPALRASSTIVYRLFDLGADARVVARALTAFRRFSLDDLDLLAALTDLDPAAVEQSFDTLVEAHLLARAENGYEFAHPILKDTLYDDLGPAERRRIHGTIARHLTAARAAGRPIALTDLATHLAASAAAGDLEAVDVLLEAARVSAVAAPTTAAGWYEHALELLPQDAPQRGEVLAQEARALFLASQLDRAAAVAAAALEVLPPGSLRSRTAALRITMLHALGRLDDALIESDALVAASAEPVPRLLAERGALLVQLDRFAEGEAEARRAMELADDDATRALAHRTLAIWAQARVDIPTLMTEHEQQLALAEHLGPAARLSALTTHALHLALLGFVSEAADTHAAAVELRDELGGDALREALDVGAAIVDFESARFEAALDRARWLAIPPSTGEVWVVLAQAAEAAVHTARGDVALARRVAAELEHAAIAKGTALWARSLVETMLGNVEKAVALLERAWRANDQSGRRSETAHLLADLVEIELGRGDAARARFFADAFLEVFDETMAPAAIVRRDRSVAMVNRDIERARNALHVAEQHGLVWQAAHVHLVLGTLGDDAATHLKGAYETYRELGAETLRRRCAHAMKEAGLDAPRRARAKAGELSETEVKLAQLVRDGLTNREIANVLIVSPKTVEVYLSRLFAKTGCESRVELAVALTEGRLATDHSIS
jgi:DNA-binding CsgD family transcriptional regulator